MARKLDRLIFKQTETAGKIAAIYVRVSSNDLKKCTRANKERVYRESIRTQQQDGKALAQARGWEYKVYANDCNMSGFDDEDRADLNEIKANIVAGKIHTVIARDPYRLSRRAELSSDLLYKFFIPYGVNLILTDFDVNIATPEGQDAFINFGLKGQAQLQYISKVSLRGKLELAKSGGYSAKPPIGWRMASRERNAVEQIPDQIKMVQRIFSEYASGDSIGKIIRGLKKDGLMRPNAGNSDWSIGDVGRLLRRVQYIGKMRFQGKLYDSPYTPIIDMATWTTVQNRLKENTKSAPRSKGSPWLASGLLTCGLCEDRKAAGGTVRFGNLHVAIASSKLKRRYPFFLCAESHRYGKKTCPGVTISQTVIDDFIRKVIALWTVSSISETTNTSEIEEEIAEAEKELQRLAKSKADLLASFVSAGGNPTDLATVTAKINTAMRTENHKIEDCQNRIQSISNREAQSALDELSKWDALDIKTKHRLLRKVLDHIAVYPDKVMVYTQLNRAFPITFKIKRVWRSKVIQFGQLDTAAMGWHMAVDFSTEERVK